MRLESGHHCVVITGHNLAPNIIELSPFNINAKESS